jgi:pimeloyl-ACP methyl ester carboxylesterase
MTSTDLRTADQRAVVRFHRAPPTVRAAFRLLELTAPDAGARWAERIWFGLPPPRLTPTTGTPFTVGRIVGESWGSGPTVYLLHGWAGHRGQLGAFVAPLVARGYRVVAFDTPSHGASGPGAFGPRSSTVPELASALAAVVAAQGPAHAVIAHSAGATATAAAVCDGLPASRLVMLAPMASPAHYARRLVRILGGGDRIHRRLVGRSERRAGPLHHLEVPALGRAVAMPPTLVVHDRDDASIPVSDGAAIAATWPSAVLRVTAGLGHRRLLADVAVVAEVVEFVAR